MAWAVVVPEAWDQVCNATDIWQNSLESYQRLIFVAVCHIDRGNNSFSSMNCKWRFLFRRVADTHVAYGLNSWLGKLGNYSCQDIARSVF